MKLDNKGFTTVELVTVLVGLGIVLAVILLPTVYGLYLAFKASIILGVLALIIEPSPAILGWLAIFGHADVAARIAHWLGL